LKKIALGLTGAVLFLLVLLVSLILLAPWLLNRPFVKDRITAALSRRLGGPVTYEHAALSVFPHPHLAVLGSSLSIPDKLSGELESLDLYADLRPLLRGKIVVTEVGLDRPVIEIRIPGRKTDQGRQGSDSAGPAGSAAAALGAAALRVAGIDFSVARGRLTLVESGRKFLTLDQLNAKVTVPPIKKNESDAESVKITGTARGMLTDVTDLPGPLTFSIPQFEAQPRSVSFNDASGSILDSTIVVSGEVADYLTSLHSIDLTLKGTAGPETVGWVRTLSGLPPEWAVRAPLALSRTRVVWRPDGTVTVNGAAKIEDGPDLSFDVSRSARRVEVKKLSLRDDRSRAELSLALEGKNLNLTFEGDLSHETLAALFPQEQFPFGWVRGNLGARVALDRPASASVRGALEGERLVPPVGLAVPVRIDRVVLKAAGRTVTFDPLELSVGGRKQTVRGTVRAGKEEWRLDLKTGDLDWDALKPLFARSERGAAGGSAEAKSPAVPTRADLRLNADSITSNGRTARPFIARISVRPGATRIDLEEARVCGIRFSGTVTVRAPESSWALNAGAKAEPLEPALNCFFRKDFRISGTFDFSGTFTTSGPKADHLRRLDGNASFKSKNGRIYHDLTIIRVLQYLNTTELLRGKLPDPEKEGLAYSKFTVRGKVKNGVLNAGEIVLVSPTVNVTGRGKFNFPDRRLDGVYLVAPFTTTDSVVKRIPLLKDVLGGSLVTIPVKVEGPFEKPSVTPLAPDAVAEELGGMMKRILKLPFKLIEPVLPKNDRKAPAGG
jgi:uncharacterized protein involved in outer membrane biogenesis